MEHKMRLVDFAFREIKSGRKTIELRLNDEKRSLINIGDTILFEHMDTKETIKCKVINLYKEKSFKPLFDRFDNKVLGLDDGIDETVMNSFYSTDEIEKYGALGIEIELI